MAFKPAQVDLSEVDLASWPAVIAVVGQIIYSVVGLLVGVVVVLAGFLLVIGGFTGATDMSVVLPGEIEFKVSTPVTGVVFVLVGAFIFWVSKYEVVMNRQSAPAQQGSPGAS